MDEKKYWQRVLFLWGIIYLPLAVLRGRGEYISLYIIGATSIYAGVWHPEIIKGSSWGEGFKELNKIICKVIGIITIVLSFWLLLIFSK